MHTHYWHLDTIVYMTISRVMHNILLDSSSLGSTVCQFVQTGFDPQSNFSPEVN